MEICDNGIDDDGDGLVDCFDDDCFGTMECEGFYFGPGSINPCTFVPPVVNEFELELLYQTNGDSFPIDQRVGAFVGDMDGDGISEIVSHNTNPGRIYIFNGEDGTIQQEIIAPSSSVFHQMVIADVDRNGLGDIFYIENGRSLIRYETGNPNPIWQTAGAQVAATFTGIHVADFNADGIPEVYAGNRIFNTADGTRLAIGTGNSGVYASSDSYTLAYDIFAPGDPRPDGGVFGAEAEGLELLAGNQVYTVELGNGTPDNGTLTIVSELNATALEGDGFVSIGDIDDDGEIDLLIMDGGRIYIWNPRTETQIGNTYQIFNTTGGGRINVGDFDNDGKAEFGTAGRNIYVVLEYDPVTNTLVELWTKTGVDDGSQRTGSSLFDFEGDGSSEVVYSEEANLFVLNGATGDELAVIPSEAGTRTEYPLVADVNGDGAAEIILTAQVGNGPGSSGGDDFISVYRSNGSPWVSARPVWNQHGYFNTNINDDLTVPLVQQDILNPALGTTFNAFLTQTTILAGGDPAFAAPDAAMEILSMSLDSCPKVETQMKIRNLGSATLPAVTPIAFYRNNPTLVAATLLDVSTIGVNIAEGDSATISYSICIPDTIMTPLDIFVVVNDTGFVAANLPYDLENDFPVTSVPECDFTNNLDSLTSPECLEICGDGKDNDGDGLADEPNITAPDTTGCSGDVLAQMTADLTGGTWSIISSIGSTISPTGVVTLGTNHSSTADFDTVIYTLAPCPDTILVSTVDDEDPSITCPANQDVIVDGSCEYELADFTGATVSDNCSIVTSIDVTQSPAIGATLSGTGANTITLTAEDEAGNTTNCTFTITLEDETDPSITCPSNQDITLDGNCEYDLSLIHISEPTRPY